MTRIVTTTYHYKPPPKRKGRKLAEITGPAVVTSVDPKRGSRRRDNQGGGQKATAAGQSTRLERADRAEPSTPPERPRDRGVITAQKAPAPANDDGPRKAAIITAKPSRATHKLPEDSPKPVIVTTSPKRRISSGPNLPMDLPASRKPVEREGDDYKRMRDAMARRLRGG